VFVISINGPANQTYVLQASSDLVNWVPINTNVPPSTPFTLNDPNASNFPRRFYRAILMP
jgi:hypothetical protein